MVMVIYSYMCLHFLKLLRHVVLMLMAKNVYYRNRHYDRFLPISNILIPSIEIVPFAGSTRRNKHTPMDDLPEPVLPTIPIFSSDFMLQVMPFKTKGRFSLYRI